MALGISIINVIILGIVGIGMIGTYRNMKKHEPCEEDLKFLWSAYLPMYVWVLVLLITNLVEKL